jgi:PAS domain
MRSAAEVSLAQAPHIRGSVAKTPWAALSCSVCAKRVRSDRPLTLSEIVHLFEGTADGAYVVDADQRIVAWNASAERLLGSRLWRINQHFHEVKMFLCTQAMDEARHLEVFRKRALANGGGLLRCRADTEMGLAGILLAPTYIQGSFLMHVGGEGLVLDLFRAGEFLAQNKCEKEIYRLCMQDEARHVSYGTMHLKYFLEHTPDREAVEEELHVVADTVDGRATRGARRRWDGAYRSGNGRCRAEGRVRRATAANGQGPAARRATGTGPKYD